MLLVSSGPDDLKNSWIMDLTCSYNMTPNKGWFDTYRFVNFDYVLMGNDASCRVFGIGIIRVKMFDGAIRTLCDVTHVPDLGRI